MASLSDAGMGPDGIERPAEWTSPLARGQERAAGSRWLWFRAAAAATLVCCLAVVALSRVQPWERREARILGVPPRPHVILLDGVNEGEWGVTQAFATFAHNDDEEHPAVQQAMEFSANETARRKERVCDFIGDMGDLLGEISTERAIEMVRRLDEVQGDAAWEEMRGKLLASEKEEAEEGAEEDKEGAGGGEGEADEQTGEAKEGGEGARRRLLAHHAGKPSAFGRRQAGRKKHLQVHRPAPRRVQSLQEGEDSDDEGGGGAEAGTEGGDAGNSTSAEGDEKPLTPRQQLLAKFGCDLNLKRVPGFWGEWYFVGQMPAPLNEYGENGPATDVASMEPNVTEVSEVVNFPDQEAINEVSHKIPPGAFAVKWTGDILIKLGGTYTFYTMSFDGSRVFIDNALVVDNSGYHGNQQRSGAVRLWEGYHSIVIDYFVGPSMSSFGKAAVLAQYSGPDTKGAVEIIKAVHNEALEHTAVSEEEEVEYVPGWWGGYYFIGQYMSPVIATGASGPVVDVATLQPNVTGISEDVNFNSADAWYAVSDRMPRPLANFAAKWIGNIEIMTAGLYSFSTTSDDGSRLWINNQMVVDNGGFHGAQKRSNSLHLTPGFHSIVADFFQGGGAASMVVQYAGPDTNGAEVLVKAVHNAELDNNTALQPIEPPEEPEWEEGFWGQYFYPPLALGSNGPSVDVSTLTPSLEAAAPEINFRSYITANDHSALTVKVHAVNPAVAYCRSTGNFVSSCDQCAAGNCQSPAAALENRDADSEIQWNPGAPAQNYNGYYIAVDAGQTVQVKAILWANDGGTTWDPTTLIVSSSNDGNGWTEVAQLDLSTLRGSKEETAIPLPAPFVSARFWKLSPGGIQWQPRPRTVGVCDTEDCAAMSVPSGAWSVGETPEEDFPINGFAAKWMGSVEIKTAGWYTFYVSSRDGARLYINDKKVVDSYATEGGFRQASSAVYLWAGFHAVVTDMWKTKHNSVERRDFWVPDAFTESAAAVLEYKGADTLDDIVVVQGVHDPALEGEAPASGDAAEAAMRIAKLMARDGAALAAARTKGAELAGDVARLHAQENQLRQREELEHSIDSVEARARQALREPVLVKGSRHGPQTLSGRAASPLHAAVRRTTERAPDHTANPRGRGPGSGGDAVRKEGIRVASKKLRWPSYRDDGDSYQLVSGLDERNAKSAALNTERRWGWVKAGLEGAGRSARGEYQAGYRAGFRAVQEAAQRAGGPWAGDAGDTAA